MKKLDSELTNESVARLLDVIQPGSKILNIKPFLGNNSNFTHLVEAAYPDGTSYKLAVRRYKVFGNYDRGEKARREYMTLKYVHDKGDSITRALLS